MCMRIAAAPVSATTPAMSGSTRSAEASLTMSATAAIAARATAALRVSIESGRPVEGPLHAGPQRRGERLQAFRAPGPRDDERRRAGALEPHDIHRELRGSERRRPKPVPGSNFLELRPVRGGNDEVR